MEIYLEITDFVLISWLWKEKTQYLCYLDMVAADWCTLLHYLHN